jgi:putative transposase
VKASLHRSKPWASYWLDRYNKEGIDGLKDRSKSGRPPEIPEELAIGIRKELLEGKQGWTTKKQVSDIHNIQKRWSKIDITILTSTEYILHKWGFKQKIPRKVHINTASREEKEDFKKGPRKYLILSQ